MNKYFKPKNFIKHYSFYKVKQKLFYISNLAYFAES